MSRLLYFGRIHLIFLVLQAACLASWGQSNTSVYPKDTLSEPNPEVSQNRLEDLLNNSETEADFDFNTLFEELETYLRHPLNLNKASAAQLEELGLLNDVQIANLISYRQLMGGSFISVYELQAVPSFDLATIRQMLPFIKVEGGLDDFQVSLGQMLTKGTNELYLRWSRVVEEQLGYSLGDEVSNRYLGGPNQFYVRFKHSYNNRMTLGFTAEKDRGEPFLRRINGRRGFDFYSFHWGLRDYNRWLRTLVVGDFTASLGQGLILFTGFGYSKSGLVTSVKRGGRPVRPYSSVNEAGFLRGAATTLAIGQQWELTAFASSRRRDGNLTQPDTTDTGEALPSISSLDLDGFHRTPAEIADRNAVTHHILGGSLRLNKNRGHLAINAVSHRLSKSLTYTPQLYNQYYFRGNQLFNASVDYNWRFRNLSLFGESAYSDNGSLATLNGLLASLDRRVDLAVVFRSYPRNFHTLLADPFAETTGARNETGCYVGLEVRPHQYWIVNGYADLWYHPWLRFGVDAPSRGREFRARVTYFRKRSMVAYVEVRSEIKDVNIPIFESPFNAILPGQRFQARLHLSLKLSPALEWRSRLDWGFADTEINDRQTGMGLYQDLLYKPVGLPISFNTRFALFDTDGYQVRFYNYENGLLYNFAVPAYYHRGSRFYLNVRYKGIRNLTLEARFAQLYWANQETVGSGLDSTGKPTRTEVSAQIKYQF